MSLTALREIFRHIPPKELPADLAACLEGDKRAIEANHQAYRRWELEDERRRERDCIHDTQDTPEVATPDLSLRAQIPTIQQQPTSDNPRARSHAPRNTMAATNTVATVHRTDKCSARGKRTQSDLAIQVPIGDSQEGQRLEGNRLIQNPNLEAPIVDRPVGDKLGRNCTTQSSELHTEPGQGLNKPFIPRRTTRSMNRKKAGEVGSRVSKKKNKGKAGTVNLEVQEFIDIPLQFAEGKELLALIGASDIPIPPYLISAPTQQTSVLELGQPSTAQIKKKRPSELVTGQTQAHEEDRCRESNTNHGGPLQGTLDQHTDGPSPPEVNTCPQPCAAADPDVSMDQDEDPYLDRVDYSDEDMLV